MPISTSEYQNSCQKTLYLNPASVAFAEDLPAAGKLFSKTQDFMAAFELMRVMQAQLSHNSLILKA